MKMIIVAALAFVGLTATAQRQEKVVDRVDQRTVQEFDHQDVTKKFKSHLFVDIQGGAQYTLGEAKFDKLISPNVQLALGYQFMPQSQPYCFGLEFGSDFSPRHEEVQSNKSDPNESSTAPGQNRLYNLRTTRNGFRPFVAIRGGYVNYDHKFMVYAKAGMSYADSKEYYEGYVISATGAVSVAHSPSPIKCSCWTPFVALGVEKSFTNNFTLRGEAEYKFARTKDHAYSDGTWVKFTQKGAINVRVLFCHNIRIGQ